jgi:hypothetical protein
MPFPFYILDVSTQTATGFRYSGTTWTRLAPPTGFTSTSGFFKTMAGLPGSPLTVYMAMAGVDALMISNDGGATWTEQSMSAYPALTDSVYSLWARVAGELYLLNNRPIAADLPESGIWKTTNAGVSWTRIIPFTGPAFSTAGGAMALGDTKLFYAELATQTPVGSDYDYGWTFNRANLDGSGVEVWATHTFSTVDHKDPYAILLRAISDDFVLAAAGIRQTAYVDSTTAQGLLWKIDASGITDVRPSAILVPWDLLPLTATRWLAVGTNQDTADVMVYRTDDAGGSWSLMTTMPAAQSFASGGSQDQFFMLSAPRPSVPDEVVMMGSASSSAQQLLWTSTDGGATWTSMPNTADSFDGTNWAVTSPGGLASVCPPAPVAVTVPARLATIVG